MAEARKITNMLLNPEIYGRGNLGPQEIEAMIQNSLQSSLVSLSLCKKDATSTATAAAASGRVAELEKLQCEKCFKIRKTRSDLK